MDYRVLIAEDNDDIRRLVFLCLDNQGYELFEAVDGQEALDKADELMPNIILLDVMMPNLTGYEVCEKLKSDPKTSGIKVMFLSSRTGLTAESAMKKVGGDAIISKPFKTAELRDRVRSLLMEPVALPLRMNGTQGEI